METTTQTPVYECPCGIRLSDDRTGKILWVQSPRTGARLELFLPIHWQTGETLPVDTDTPFVTLPPRLLGRVTVAVATGRHSIGFTREELHAFKAAFDARNPAPSAGTRPRRGRQW